MARAEMMIWVVSFHCHLQNVPSLTLFHFSSNPWRLHQTCSLARWSVSQCIFFETSTAFKRPPSRTHIHLWHPDHQVITLASPSSTWRRSVSLSWLLLFDPRISSTACLTRAVGRSQPSSRSQSWTWQPLVEFLRSSLNLSVCKVGAAVEKRDCLKYYGRSEKIPVVDTAAVGACSDGTYSLAAVLLVGTHDSRCEFMHSHSTLSPWRSTWWWLMLQSHEQLRLSRASPLACPLHVSSSLVPVSFGFPRIAWSATRWTCSFGASRNPNSWSILSYDLAAVSPFEWELTSQDDLSMLVVALLMTQYSCVALRIDVEHWTSNASTRLCGFPSSSERQWAQLVCLVSHWWHTWGIHAAAILASTPWAHDWCSCVASWRNVWWALSAAACALESSQDWRCFWCGHDLEEFVDYPDVLSIDSQWSLFSVASSYRTASGGQFQQVQVATSNSACIEQAPWRVCSIYTRHMSLDCLLSCSCHWCPVSTF